MDVLWTDHSGVNGVEWYVQTLNDALQTQCAVPRENLNRNTVASRVDEIAENLRDQYYKTISTFQAYSIAIDESRNTRNIAQLAIFIRGCDANLKINEEFLKAIPMHNTKTGVDIFDALMEVVNKYKLPLDKLVCLATDGAPTMTDSHGSTVESESNVRLKSMPKVGDDWDRFDSAHNEKIGDSHGRNRAALVTSNIDILLRYISEIDIGQSSIGDICSAYCVLDDRTNIIKVVVYISPNNTVNNIIKFLYKRLMIYGRVGSEELREDYHTLPRILADFIEFHARRWTTHGKLSTR
ncbi:general transcription factor II-I repeat domain-containing protein 2 [Trichonephila clavipes]|nr:general transcription factor II-I repeat domain-containing protein 2 [Trichonephila clavipes]